MPFDGMPEALVSDLVKLQIALEGVKSNWRTGRFGLPVTVPANGRVLLTCGSGFIDQATDAAKPAGGADV